MKKIRDEELLEMLRQGKTQKEAAQHFGVSPVAVSKRLKRLLPPPDLSALTEKQKAFAIEVAKGKNATDAAIIAYECKDRRSAKVIGSQQLDNPEVKEAIADLMDSLGFTRRFKVERLKHFAGHADGNVALKAIDMGLKLRDEYPRNRTNEVSQLTEITITVVDHDRTQTVVLDGINRLQDGKYRWAEETSLSGSLPDTPPTPCLPTRIHDEVP